MIYLLIGLTLLLTLWPIWWLWRARPLTKLEGFWRMLAAAAVIWFAHTAGAWGFISVYLRDLSLVLFLFAVIRALRRLRYLPWAPPKEMRGWVPLMFPDTVFIVFLVLNLMVYRGRAYERNAIDLHFPLRGGTYYVLQGGSSVFGSYFHKPQSDERYALDIVRLNAQGNRASGIMPVELTAYAIYGDTVVSPCAGRILEIVTGHPDEPPAHRDPTHSPGNYIRLDCGNVQVLLGHLTPDSLPLAAGDSVAASEPLARVGNSGNSIEPHLHISASHNDGRPAAMRFKGRYLSLNSVIRTKK